MPKVATPAESAKKYISEKYVKASMAVRLDNYLPGPKIRHVVQDMLQYDSAMKSNKTENIAFCKTPRADPKRQRFELTKKTALSTALFLKSLSNRELVQDDTLPVVLSDREDFLNDTVAGGPSESVVGNKRPRTTSEAITTVEVFSISDNDLEDLLYDIEYRRQTICEEIERRANLSRDIFHGLVISALEATKT